MSYAALYIKLIPAMTFYSTVIAIDAGLNLNKRKPDENDFIKYTNVIGYTSLGIITGITYGISYPLFGCHVLRRLKTDF